MLNHTKVTIDAQSIEIERLDANGHVYYRIDVNTLVEGAHFAIFPRNESTARILEAMYNAAQCPESVRDIDGELDELESTRSAEALALGTR